MNIGIITVRGPDYHPNQRLCEAAVERGHRVTLVHPYRVWPSIIAAKHGLVIPPDFETPDVLMPRQGATIGNSCLALIQQCRLMGIPVVNELEAIRLAKHQFFALMTLAANKIPVPDTFFINALEGFEAAVDQLGGPPVVIKQVSGRQGKGVLLVKTIHEFHQIHTRHLDQRSGLLVQRFIPPDGRRDIRILVLGKEIVGAMELTPKSGDFRSNYHITGESHPTELSSELKAVALKASKTIGLEIAGVDVILDRRQRINVIEVNYSPGFKGLEAATGLDVAGRMVDYVIATYCKREGGNCERSELT